VQEGVVQIALVLSLKTSFNQSVSGKT
jgi:hypothetical protein